MSLLVNTVLNLAIMLFGAPAVTYVFSNVGYVISFTPVLFAFWLLRKYHPELPRPYRLPDWMTPLAPILGVIFFIIWIGAGPLYATQQAGALWAYIIGWVVLLAYVPLYYYRKWVEDRRAVPAPPAPTEEAPTRFA